MIYGKKEKDGGKREGKKEGRAGGRCVLVLAACLVARAPPSLLRV